MNMEDALPVRTPSREFCLLRVRIVCRGIVQQEQDVLATISRFFTKYFREILSTIVNNFFLLLLSSFPDNK